MISIAEAFQRIAEAVRPQPTETAPLTEMVGRYLRDPVTADIDSPPHDKSMMDGFAVRSADIQPGASLEVLETVIAGAQPTQPLGPGQTTRIMTGAPLPRGADAVVMVELANVTSDSACERVSFELDSIAPEKHVLRRGANFESSQLLFESGHCIRPSDVGLLAEVGIAQANVHRKPRLAVLATGDELVDCRERPQAAQIRNSNGPLIVALAQDQGLQVTDLGIGRDDPQQLGRLIANGLEHDVLVLTGGVSAGTRDLVPDLLSQQGVQEVFHKVAIKPGKPLWFGTLDRDDRQVVVVGLPGNPLSSLVGYRLFVTAALSQMLGGRCDPGPSWPVELAIDHETRGNRPTYWPGQVSFHAERQLVVTPLRWNGSSDLWALGRADGLIHFPADRHQHRAGEPVKFLPLGTPKPSGS